MFILGWYIDPIYIVIVTLLFVFLYLARLDYRFGKIAKSLDRLERHSRVTASNTVSLEEIGKLMKGVNDASQTIRTNSDHLADIAYNTTPELVWEYRERQSTDQIAVPVPGNLPSLDATQPIPVIRRVDIGASMQYDEPQLASFCASCGTPARWVTGNLRPAGNR